MRATRFVARGQVGRLRRGPLRLIWPFFRRLRRGRSAERRTNAEAERRNDDRAIVVATFCWTTVRSRLRRPPIREKDPFFARWRDHDPSRIPLSHGNGDFGQRAWRDHVELPDSAAELPFGCRGGLLARRLRCNSSGRDRTPYRQEPESGSDHTETTCKTLHRHRETH